jgi:hypothetical protein
MKIRQRQITLGIASLALCWTALIGAAEQNARDALETLRSDLKANRTAMIAQELQLSQQESNEFWPIYRAYRSEVEKTTDNIVKLILQYADEYPNVSDEKAKEMLQEYLKTEGQLLKIKEKYFKSLGKVLPATKVFRFAQLDNRYDLGIRVGMATSIPILGSTHAEPASK